MRKLILLVAALLLLGCTVLAEETVTVQSSLFSVTLPAALNPDLDEFTRANFPFINHIHRPIVIQGDTEEYGVLITLYDFESKARHRIDNQKDKPMALFALISQCIGMDGQLKPRLIRMEDDYRDFVVSSLPEKGYYLATLYNPKRGEGYTFELRVKNGALSAEAAEAQLLSIATTLREAGIVYPENTGMTLRITHPGINVRSGPNVDSKVLTVAQQDQTFPYLGDNGLWYMVDVNGQIGYVSKALSVLQE